MCRFASASLSSPIVIAMLRTVVAQSHLVCCALDTHKVARIHARVTRADLFLALTPLDGTSLQASSAGVLDVRAPTTQAFTPASPHTLAGCVPIPAMRRRSAVVMAPLRTSHRQCPHRHLLPQRLVLLIFMVSTSRPTFLRVARLPLFNIPLQTPAPQTLSSRRCLAHSPRPPTAASLPQSRVSSSSSTASSAAVVSQSTTVKSSL
mmetsp:Transcript_12837/g.25890  ORF Transcript_12837/g.25890 Transcript_12837/m.25890 type:complete len:206 (-) Transcript_12837:912-1529(-)